jgi:hypothetical protein
VLNDNALRGPQWQRLMGEFFPPRRGATSGAWAHANRAVIMEVESPAAVAARRSRYPAYADYDRALLEDWLRGMIQLVGVSAPPPDQIVPLALEAMAFTTRCVRAAFPEAVAAVQALYALGYPARFGIRCAVVRAGALSVGDGCVRVFRAPVWPRSRQHPQGLSRLPKTRAEGPCLQAWG